MYIVWQKPVGVFVRELLKDAYLDLGFVDKQNFGPYRGLSS